MRRTIATVALAAILLLAGCAGTPAANPTSATPTATPTPTPTAMSAAEAGEKYLSGVCPNNAMIVEFNTAWDTQKLAAIKAAAVKGRDAARNSAVLFSDASVLWPDGLSDDLKLIADAYFADIAYYDSVANAKSLEAAGAVVYPDATAAAAAAQKVRAKLGLPADTQKSCTGK